MRLRLALALVTFASLSLWASGQGPAPSLSAGEQLKMLARNQRLLDDLVERGLGMSAARSPLARIEECRKTTDRLSDELRHAVDRNDSDRIAEIGDHLHLLVSDALVPNLREARDQIRPESADYPLLLEREAQVQRSVNELNPLLPTTGELSKSRRVQLTREKLQKAAQDVQGNTR